MIKFLRAVTMFLGISALTLIGILICEYVFDLGRNDSALIYEER